MPEEVFRDWPDTDYEDDDFEWVSGVGVIVSRGSCRRRWYLEMSIDATIEVIEYECRTLNIKNWTRTGINLLFL